MIASFFFYFTLFGDGSSGNLVSGLLKVVFALEKLVRFVKWVVSDLYLLSSSSSSSNLIAVNNSNSSSSSLVVDECLVVVVV